MDLATKFLTNRIKKANEEIEAVKRDLHHVDNLDDLISNLDTDENNQLKEMFATTHEQTLRCRAIKLVASTSVNNINNNNNNNHNKSNINSHSKYNTNTHNNSNNNNNNRNKYSNQHRLTLAILTYAIDQQPIQTLTIIVDIIIVNIIEIDRNRIMIAQNRGIFLDREIIIIIIDRIIIITDPIIITNAISIKIITIENIVTLMKTMITTITTIVIPTIIVSMIAEITITIIIIAKLIIQTILEMIMQQFRTITHTSNHIQPIITWNTAKIFSKPSHQPKSSSNRIQV